MNEEKFLIVQEYRCPLCGEKLEFFRRNYDKTSLGGRHPESKCLRSLETYYVPHASLTIMDESER